MYNNKHTLKYPNIPSTLCRVSQYILCILNIIYIIYNIYRVYNNVYISILNNNMYIYFKISENLPNLTIVSKNVKVK